MQNVKDQIINLIRLKGPVLPVQISREINTNILFSSAILSEMVSKRDLKITNVKVGGSPLYYLPGQEAKLQGFSDYLGEKPKQAYLLLREKKVLKDKTCEPWQRVALREINDFAVMLNVSVYGEIETFWKWYLLSDEQAKEFIKNMLEERTTKLQEFRAEKIEENLEKKPEVIQESKPGEKEQEIKTEEVLVQESKKREKAKKTAKDKIDFYGLVSSYFNRNRILLLEEKIVRKNMDFEFLVEVLSEVGGLKFFVSAKNKKTIREADLSLVHSKARGRPILFLSSGELTKGAKNYLDKTLKDNFIFKKI